MDCWQTHRFDYWRWHGIENLGDGHMGVRNRMVSRLVS